jgi:hypothetical protein
MTKKIQKMTLTTNKTFLAVVTLIVISLVVTIFTPESGVTGAKVAGLLLATILVVPVWLLLAKAFRSQNTTGLIFLFVGGFLFKLVGLTAMTFWVVRMSGWNSTEYLSGCIPLLIALQTSESLYFWRKSSETGVKLS